MVQGLLSTEQTLHVHTNAQSIEFLQCRRLTPRARLAEPKAAVQGCWEVLAHPGTRGCMRRSVTLILCWLLLEELCLVVFFLLSSVYFTVTALQKNKK